MKSVRYILGHTRILRASDLDALGIKHKDEELVWNKENNFTVVMNNQTSDSLVERLPTEFVIVDEEEADETSDESSLATSPSSSHPEASQSDPESSVASGDDEVGQSTRNASKNS